MLSFLIVRRSHLAALLGGLALAAAFPGWNIASLAWLVPGVWVFAAAGPAGWRTLQIGYLGGLTFHLAALHWLLYNPFPAGAIAGWIALSLYLAFYQAAWVWLCWRLLPNPARRPASFSWSQQMDALLELPWWQRAAWALACAAAWVALEMVQARLFSGFPWNLLGVSQHRMFPLIQIASTTGVYGVSFLVVWTSVSLGLALLRLLRLPSARWGWMSEVRLPLLTVLIVFCLGVFRTYFPAAPTREIKLALVQPSIPQEVIWDPRENSNRFVRILELSELAVTTKPDVLVWPESSLPGLTEENYQQIVQLITSNQVYMILGADDAEPRANRADPEPFDYYNAAHLLDRDAARIAVYRKRQLVIFGEYVPFVRHLPFLQRLTPIEAGFARGPGPVPFPIGSPKCRTSVLICFEDVFPHLARRSVDPETDFLLNLTNDGWFGQSAAQWQQAANAAFRAVENGLPLVRCTNNGLTCWIDAFGRVRQWLGEDTGDIYAPGFLAVRIPLLPEGAKRPTTFYNRYGDLFGWTCVVTLLLLLSLRIRSARSLLRV